MSDTTSTLSTGEWLLRFLLFPAAIIAVIWFLWALPGWLKRGSVRPGQPWVGAPLWVSGPPTGTPAIGGSEAEADRGGASARW